MRFGTSGWRGVFGEEFTFPRLRAASRGVAAWFAEAGGGDVVVAHDTRFQGERMADQAARILVERGLRAIRGRGPLPTPAAVRAVVRRRAAGALVLTASHNPPEYQGLKVFGPGGAAVDEAAARRIERAIARAASAPPAELPLPRPVDLGRPYVRELAQRLARGGSTGARPRVFFDALHGAGAGVLDAALERWGARVVTSRAERDPDFGGAAPDPTPARLRELAARVRGARGLRLGLATDGDADRFAVVDETGRLLSATQALALLVDHLARRGRIRRGVALSIATGGLVERVARAHGLAVSRHPIGFKHLARPLVTGAAEVAGEESGGFAWASFHPDKDGILAGCLLAELAAQAGPLGVRLAELEARHGASCCGRLAVADSAGARRALERLTAAPPARVDGCRVTAASDRDGLHLSLPDGFLMLRASGTEPALRVYAEAPGPARLRRRLAAGAALLGASGDSRGSR